jgi:hypothetical protein
MNRARNHFFTRARFTGDQNGTPGGGDLGCQHHNSRQGSATNNHEVSIALRDSLRLIQIS